MKAIIFFITLIIMIVFTVIDFFTSDKKIKFKNFLYKTLIILIVILMCTIISIFIGVFTELPREVKHLVASIFVLGAFMGIMQFTQKIRKTLDSVTEVKDETDNDECDYMEEDKYLNK